MTNVIRVHGNFGERMLSELKEDFEKNNKDYILWDDSYPNNDKSSFWDVKKLLQNNELGNVILIPFYIAENVIEEVLVLGVPREKIFVYEGKSNEKKNYIPLNDFVFLPYLEIHAADHCNLNCKGCSAFCPCVKSPIFPDYERFESDLKRLKELVPCIRTIQIMGGEPTLNPNLHLFIDYAKKIYPYCNLKIMTNGTTLDRVKNEVWDSIIKNDVTIDISCYPAVYERMETIVKTINDHGAKEPVLNQISVFYPNLSEYKKYPFRNTDHCRCYNLRDGKISSCNMIMYGHYFNSYFNENLPFDSGIYDIYNDKITGKELVERLNTPCEMCNYCSQYIWCLNQKYARQEEWNYYKGSEKPNKKDWY